MKILTIIVLEYYNRLIESTICYLCYFNISFTVRNYLHLKKKYYCINMYVLYTYNCVIPPVIYVRFSDLIF